jgi:hypothetical protein
VTVYILGALDLSAANKVRLGTVRLNKLEAGRAAL